MPCYSGATLLSALSRAAARFPACGAQAALWLVWKSAKGDRNKLAVPLSVFGLHLFLGNWWNGARPACGRAAGQAGQTGTLRASMAGYNRCQLCLELVGPESRTAEGARSGVLRPAGAQAQPEVDGRLLALGGWCGAGALHRARPEALPAVRRGGCMVACLLPKELYQVARVRVRGCAPSALCPMPYALCALCAPAGTIASFYDIEPTAGLLMVPTQVCVWRGCTCPDGSKLLAHGLLHRLSSLRNP